MDKLDEKLEQDLAKIGIYIEPKLPFITDPRKGLIGVRIEIGADNMTSEPPEFNITAVNKRGVRTTISDFMLVETPQGRKFTFLAYQQLPDDCRPPLTTEHVATSFVDLCYFQGNEAVDPNYIPPVSTKIAPNAVKKDLGWYLPSRFVDTIIDALGKVNEVFLSGFLEEAILYGIITKNDASELTVATALK